MLTDFTYQKPPPVIVELRGGPRHGMRFSVSSDVEMINVPVVVNGAGIGVVRYRPTAHRTEDEIAQIWVPQQQLEKERS